MTTLLLTKIWEFIKTYKYHIIVTSAVVLFLYGTYAYIRHQNDNILKLLKAQQAVHEEEVEKIKQTYEEERKEHEANVTRLQTTLDEVQRKHEDDMRYLENRKTENIEKLVTTWKKDPTGVEMAKQLGQLTGFKVIIPEN